MGLWDWFRKKKEVEISSEKVKAEELENWLKNKKSEIENQETSFLKSVEQRIVQLISELEEEISVLKKVNVDEKKAEEKIKLIVRENLKNYIEHIEKLKEKLEEIKANKGIIEKINSIFPDFEKKSKMSFEKATFLIGKEIGDTKDSIRNFFRDLEKIIKENKKLIDKSKIFSSAEMKMKKIGEIKKIMGETEEATGEYDSRINNLKDKIKLKEKELEEIRSSEKFIEQEKREKEREKKKQEIEKEIRELREIIDFKALASFFHSFQKEMAIIKAYKENFKNAFDKSGGEELLGLIKEAKLEPGALKKFGEISEMRKEIESIKIEKTGIENLEEEVKKINEEAELVNSKKSAEEKKAEKLDLNYQEILSLLKQELDKINVQIV